MKSPFSKGNQRKRRETKIDSVCLTSLEENDVFQALPVLDDTKEYTLRSLSGKFIFTKCQERLKQDYAHAVRLGQMKELGQQSSEEDIYGRKYGSIYWSKSRAWT